METSTTIQSSRLIKATPFFYGWIILVVGTIGIIMIGPSQTFTVAIFIDAFTADLGISRANVALIYGLATLGASFLLPVTGRLVDRYGPRRMILITAFGLGLASIGMSLVQGVLTGFLGMLALRFWGFGSMQLVSNNIIAQWFIRRRGMVMGLAGLSLAAGLTIFPGLTDALINQFAWRGAWLALGALVWAIMLPVGWLFFKDRPELYGLLPDGDTRPVRKHIQTESNAPNEVDEADEAPEENWTLAEARRTSLFWLFVAALTTIAMVTAGLVFHHLSLFTVRGLSRELAVGAFRIIAFFSMVGNLAMGRLLDRYSPRRLLSLTLFILVAAMVLVQVMTTSTAAFVYAALLGTVTGMFRVIDAVVWAKYYGRRYLGSIRGATMLGVVGGTALGAYPLGLSLDYLGSYGPALTALLSLPIASGLIVLFIKPPEKKSDL